ncbi:MAG TPA: carbohydrate ABC transporter permease, partial [Thermoanaerobaculia bacterium]|nr:carbohydrate ABC transporter permease [Thermoanaerobaculia bacterium]
MERATLRKIGARSLHVLVLAFFIVALAFPFFWMVVATFKQNIDLYTVENNPFLFNLPPTLEHLRFLFGETRFVRWLGNTALVGVLVVAITLLLAVPAAYALARLKLRGGALMTLLLLITQLLPAIVIATPLFVLFSRIGLLNSYPALILADTTITLPFAAIILR